MASKRVKLPGGDEAAAPSAAGAEAAALEPVPRIPPMSAIKAAYSAAPQGRRDKEEALRCFLEALEANPNDSFTHHKLGLLYEEEFRDRQRARECFERAIECNARNAPALNSLGLLIKPTDKHKALEYFQQSIAVDPGYGRAHKNMGLLYLHEFNDLTRARECFMECLRVDPHNASAYVSVGQMCERQKEYKAAEQYYEMSIQCDSRNPIGYFRMGVLMHGRRDFAAARRNYELAVKACPSDVKHLVKLAKLVEGEPFKDFYAARRCYRTAIHHSPEDATWISNRVFYIEDRLLPKDDDGKPIILPEHNTLFEEDNEHTPLGNTIEMMRQASTSSNDLPLPTCPRRHVMRRIAAKPLTYKPQATWACEECHKSIGGIDLRINGALHCAICKYDLCSTCAVKPKTAHVLPDEPTLMGSGAFGEVYREYDPTSEMYVAVKYVRTPDHKTSQAVQKEVRIMKLFAQSQYIVRVLRLELEKRQARVFMELMAGSVASQIDRWGPVHETQARIWIHEALCGLATLHTAGRPVVHRDIKPENLLLTSDGHLKLSDFGLSKNIEATAIAQTIGPKGTPLYTAPECYEDPPRFTYACDIWGLACSWVCMTTGYHPWHGVFEASARFENIGYRLSEDPRVTPRIPEHLTPEARALLTRMLERDRRKRPTAEMVLADDYFGMKDLLERAESYETYQSRKEAYIHERRAVMQSTTEGAGNESGQVVMHDGYSLMTPATPTAALEAGAGLFPAIDTSSVIAAPPSVPSWSSMHDVDTSPTGRTSVSFDCASSSTRQPSVIMSRNHSALATAAIRSPVGVKQPSQASGAPSASGVSIDVRLPSQQPAAPRRHPFSTQRSSQAGSPPSSARLAHVSPGPRNGGKDAAELAADPRKPPAFAMPETVADAAPETAHADPESPPVAVPVPDTGDASPRAVEGGRHRAVLATVAAATTLLALASFGV